MRAQARLDFEARIGTARQRVGADNAGEEEKCGRCMFLRGQDEAARGDEIIKFRRENFADHHAGRPAFQRLFHGPERFFGVRRMDEEKAIWIDPVKGEPRSI
jgi:hypothetical protein